MKVRINGVDERISEANLTLEQLIADRGLSPKKVVIELNLSIVPREQWPQITLQDADSIEIVSFVGGG
ncbi:MAG TPA: sulfur carrier protein ThiS [Smithellaceae bacterium]|jgi:thiamine biosynthesis protein ThiS|nr:sulfur carrier protein ThiS [Smithellaceae bacterium]